MDVNVLAVILLLTSLVSGKPTGGEQDKQPVVKPGVCHDFEANGANCDTITETCNIDWDCPGAEKCCYDGCGQTVCAQPERIKGKCFGVICPRLKCAYGEVSEIQSEDCCPVCVKNCESVSCHPMDCSEVDLYIPDGECCPKCLDCPKDKACPPKERCETGHSLRLKPGDCCKKCVPDCKTCQDISCQLGYVLTLKTGACCKTCVHDCLLDQCPVTKCGRDKMYIPDGSCCHHCLAEDKPGDFFCPYGLAVKNHKCGPKGTPCPPFHFCNIFPKGGYAMCCEGCLYYGGMYSIRERFPTIDGLNSCGCNAEGSATCTKESYGGCIHKGFLYSHGDSFSDGCNTCTCMKEGNVTCSTNDCAGFCRNGLSPIADNVCGGRSKLKCKGTDYECQYHNAPSNTKDVDGICCKAHVCQLRTVQLHETYCSKDRVCPSGFVCEFVATGEDIGFCCTEACEYKNVKYRVGHLFYDGFSCKCICMNDRSVVCTGDCEDNTGYCPYGIPVKKHKCGPGGKPCPANHFCNISPKGEYAKCCEGCLYFGKMHSIDDTFPSIDGLNNTCGCNDKGSASCSENDHRIGGCFYKGLVYSLGVSFNDRCNTCTCKKGGDVTCSKKDCTGFCQNGLSPTAHTICGGDSKLGCKGEGYECDYYNARHNLRDVSGICCKGHVCQAGGVLHPETYCTDSTYCPLNFECELVTTGEDIGFCCTGP